MKGYIINTAENAVKLFLMENATSVGTENYKCLARTCQAFLFFMKTRYENY